MIIGVCGPVCAGKSSICLEIVSHGFDLINVDHEGHRALRAQQSAIVDLFGLSVLTEDGDIDRGALGKIVFAHRAKLRALESVVHPVMRENISAYIKQHAQSNMVIDATLLYQLHLDRYCDIIFRIHASLWKRIRRARYRSRQPTDAHTRHAEHPRSTPAVSYIRIAHLMRAQRGLYLNVRDNSADIIYVYNNSSISALRQCIHRHMRVLMEGNQ